MNEVKQQLPRVGLVGLVWIKHSNTINRFGQIARNTRTLFEAVLLLKLRSYFKSIALITESWPSSNVFDQNIWAENISKITSQIIHQIVNQIALD